MDKKVFKFPLIYLVIDDNIHPPAYPDHRALEWKILENNEESESINGTIGHKIKFPFK